jgi:Tfp pilus assembly protein PilX
MRKPSPSCKRDSGAALLLALWALFLLAGVVFAWALNINSRLTVSATANRVLSAEAMASSGAEVALNPAITPASANLHKKMTNESYDVEMSGECGRLNLNFLTLGGAENPVVVAVLKKYLTNKGVDLNDLDVMMDSLLDWVSPTKGLHRLNAPEETDDYRPPHAPLTSVDELKRIFGWAEYTSHPGWDKDFTTIVFGCQQIDPAYASRDVLRALGIQDAFVDRFLQLRQGPDGIDGTADDGVVDPQTVSAMLGLNNAQQQQGGIQQVGNPQGGIQNLIAQYKTTNVFRVVSVGKSGGVTRSVQMVMQKPMMMQAGTPATPFGALAAFPSTQANNPTIFSWKEL